ncbi:MAG: T9SS type A sorting domain-containing protein [Candidatus Marinimicrobia bacterium]|nr:T9SS type A sorting domain-containing protein [Candidatus Neomarinimicrobiota bacterium]
MRVRVWVIFIAIISFLFANSPFYAVQTHFGQYRRADMDSLSMELQLDLVYEAGIEMIRDECLWSDVEIDSGIYVIPPEVDRYVSSALARGIDVYMILNYNNTLYATSNGSGVTIQANRDAYARYCQAIVGHFSPMGVKHYEIWNEPNHGVLFWIPQPDANDYTLLLQTAYDSIKAIDTTVTVIGCATSPAIGNPAPFIEGLDFIRDVFAAGGGDFMDAVSFHLYQVAYRPEYEFRSYANSVKSFVGDKPIYFSEFGYPTHTAWPNITLEKQARYVTRMYLACLMDPQVRSVVYYDLKNDGTVYAEPEHNFGLLEFNRSPKPAYTGLKTLISNSNASRPLSYSAENDIFTVRMSDSLNIAWAYSGTKSIKLAVDAQYVRIEGILGDTVAYHITANDTISLNINEDPVYSIVLDEKPLVDEFTFLHKDYLFYPGESIKCNYNASTANGISIVIDPSALNWIFIGQNGLLENNNFIANSPGEGIIVGEIQGKRDTIFINVLEDPGYYTAETFSDTDGFVLESSSLNMNVSGLIEQGGTNWDALALSYEYSGSSATAYLHKNILINHLADSIFLDFKTDDKEYEFRIYCRDGNGVSYTLGLRPRPTDWINSWGTLGGPMSIDGSAMTPVYIEKIYIKLKPGTTTQTTPYSGLIMFDNLRIKRGDAVGIKDENLIPGQIFLSQNYPNPFNGISRIYFHLPYDSQVRIDIFDLKGAVINTPVHSMFRSGEHYFDLDMQNIPSGVYIYRLSNNTEMISKKFVYMK